MSTRKKALKKKKKQKPPAKKIFSATAAEDIIEGGEDYFFSLTRLMVGGKKVFLITKKCDREGTLCFIKNIKRWSMMGKLLEDGPANGLYKTKVNGEGKIILSPDRKR